MEKIFSKLEFVSKHRRVLILISLSFVVGAILGGNILEKYLAVVIGFFTALIAFIGVAYAQNKQSVFIKDQLSHSSMLQEAKLIHESKEAHKKFIIEKSEEILFKMNLFYTAILEKNNVTVGDSIEQDFVKLNSIVTLHELYLLGDDDKFQKYRDVAMSLLAFYINLLQLKDFKDIKEIPSFSQDEIDRLRSELGDAHRLFFLSVIAKVQKYQVI